MDSRAEFEKQPPKPIKLGQEVFPFSGVKKTIDQQTRTENYDKQIPLLIPFGDNIKIVNVQYHLHNTKSDGLEIVPFHRELGYQITSDDFSLESRRNKLRQYAKDDLFIDPRFPLYFGIFIDPSDLEKAGIIESAENPTEFIGNSKAILQSLRSIVSAEGLYISAEPDFPENKAEAYYFHGYHPADSPPLASTDWATLYFEDEDKLMVGPGHSLHFADNPHEISQIGVRFIIDPLLYKQALKVKEE